MINKKKLAQIEQNTLSTYCETFIVNCIKNTDVCLTLAPSHSFHTWWEESVISSLFVDVWLLLDGFAVA